MYAVRRWSVRHARGMEVFYAAFERVLVALHPLWSAIGYERLDRPVAGSLLYSLEAPPWGGDTQFCNMYLAYESLSEGLQKAIEPLVLMSAAAAGAGYLTKLTTQDIRWVPSQIPGSQLLAAGEAQLLFPNQISSGESTKYLTKVLTNSSLHTDPS